MYLLIIRIYSFLIAQKIHRWSKKPIASQKKLLQEILQKTQGSQYRRDHAIEDVPGYEAFREQVPLQNFEHLKQYVEKISKGEDQVLSKDKPAYLVMTSGTTSGKKYIPVTKRGLAYYLKGGGDSLFYYIHVHKKYNLFAGKILPFSGSQVLDKIGKIYSGRVSSLFNHQHTRLYKWFNKKYRLPSEKANAIPVWEEKVNAIVEETHEEDVRVIIGLPIWIQNYFDGILAKGHDTVLDAFPNLQLFIHGGLSMKPYQQHINKLIHPSKRIDFVEVYNGSEGFYAFQNDIHDENLLLHLNSGIFYEFIPLNHQGDRSQARIPLWEAEAGQEYELIISTISGVLAYETGDTIRITQTHPFKIVWTGRTAHFTSAFNEHVIAEEVEQAIEKAVDATTMNVVEFTVAPEVDLENQSARYDWYIEFSPGFEESKLPDFVHELDECIIRKNHLYRELRHANILKQPKVTRIQENGFFSYMKARGKLGDQYKVVHLSNDREMVNTLSKWAIS